MGKFSERVKKLFNPKSGVKTEHKLNHDAYFIRLADNPDVYIHYIGEKGKDEVEYRPVKGVEGAAIWKWKKAWAFIREFGASNLELIRVDQVLPIKLEPQ